MLNMTPNILKNLFSKTATRMYPVEVRAPFAEYRGELVNDIKECIFCGSCQRKCPSQCITVDKKVATWDYDPFICVFCGICVDNCPTNCLEHKHLHRAPAVEREQVHMKGEIKKKSKKTKKKDD